MSVVVRLQRGCGKQGCSLWQGPGASPAEHPSGEAPLAVKRLHSPDGKVVGTLLLTGETSSAT